jgi:hypothetical protein
MHLCTEFLKDRTNSRGFENAYFVSEFLSLGYHVLLVHDETVFLKNVFYIPEFFTFSIEPDFYSLNVNGDQSVEGVETLYVKSSNQTIMYFRDIVSQQPKSVATFQDVWTELRKSPSWSTLHSAFLPERFFPPNMDSYTSEYPVFSTLSNFIEHYYSVMNQFLEDMT